jgi:hypothetical protein
MAVTMEEFWEKYDKDYKALKEEVRRMNRITMMEEARAKLAAMSEPQPNNHQAGLSIESQQ